MLQPGANPELSTAEIACHSTPEQAGLRVETVPFDQIPQQSKLFLDYLRDPTALRRFYPEAVKDHFDLIERRERVLANYKTDRTAVCDALERLNRSWGASERTLKHIQTLRESDCMAVVSGQQAGLFGGPLYTIYKALSAVKLADCLSQRGVKAVPVFWIASEDHDFDEVAAAHFINRDCTLASVAVSDEIHAEGLPVGRAILNESITSTVEALLRSLPQSEFIDELRSLLSDGYQPQRTFSDAFARTMTYLTAARGLILLDPLDVELKRLAAPIYATAARHAPELAKAIADRSRELETAGYHAQVTPSENSFPLFLHDERGARHALTRNNAGKYQAKSANHAYTTEELADWAQREPD